MSGSAASVISCSVRHRTGLPQIRHRLLQPPRSRSRLRNRFRSWSHSHNPRRWRSASRSSRRLISPLATTGIILVVTIFALLQKEDLRDRAIRLLGSHDLQRIDACAGRCGAQAQPLFSDPARPQYQLRRDRRRRAVPDRRAAPGAVGHSRRPAPVHSLYRFVDRRVAARSCSRRRSQPGLGDGDRRPPRSTP